MFGWGGGGGEGWTVRCFVPLMHFCIGKYQSVPRLLARIVALKPFCFVFSLIATQTALKRVSLRVLKIVSPPFHKRFDLCCKAVLLSSGFAFILVRYAMLLSCLFAEHVPLMLAFSAKVGHRA